MKTTIKLLELNKIDSDGYLFTKMSFAEPLPDKVPVLRDFKELIGYAYHLRIEDNHLVCDTDMDISKFALEGIGIADKDRYIRDFSIKSVSPLLHN